MELEDGSQPPGKAAIFILGITPRSGTNFLSDLLCLHQDCAAPAPILEDHLTYHADLLIHYVTTVSQSWRPNWNISQDLQASLCRSLGNGLIEFLSLRVSDKRLVTKTPSVRNLQHFFTVFPGARLLILIRDGRDVVESMVKSFGTNPEWVMRRWAEGARLIHQFKETTQNAQGKYLIVRYEDLVQNLQSELPRILSFLGLSTGVYNFEGAATLPVKGSCEFRLPEQDTVHWTPVEKPIGFNPIRRWCSWDQTMHDRFNWIAGPSLLAFGYEPVENPTNSSWLRIRNRLHDLRWYAGALFRPSADALRRKGIIPVGYKRWRSTKWQRL